jgi:O-antigen ligase
MLRSFSSVRLYLICFAAVALALPIAIVSLAKLLALLGALIVLLHGWWRRDERTVLASSGITPMILLALLLLTLSALWSTGSGDEVLTALAKHARLILIPVILILARSRRDALIALGFFVGGQIFLLGSTWLLYAGVALPWVMSKEAGICDICSFAVFSSYLDQSIMTAVLAAICWQLRSMLPTRYRTALALLVAGLALACVFFVFQGRTGHLVAIALVLLATVWEFPRRLHLKVILIGLLVLVALAAGSSRMGERFREVGSSMQTFNPTSEHTSSPGMRLDLWHRSLQSLAENPWMGSGVGSWNREFRRQEVIHAKETPINEATKQHHNPHQEYLLWGVEMGLPGILLLCCIFLALYRNSQKLAVSERRALQSVLLALLVACLFNCALHDAMIGDFFCITLGLLLALGLPVAVHPSAVPLVA